MITRKKLRRQRDALIRRLTHLQERIPSLHGGSALYDIAEESALRTALSMFDERMVELEEQAMWDNHRRRRYVESSL